MKWLQNGNLAKLVAFFVISVVITCTVSFAANGWESFVKDGASGDNTVIGDNNGADNSTDRKDEIANNDVTVSLPLTKYYHSITGLETGLEASLRRPLAFIFSSTDPLYGISSSYLTIEIPTEYGNTRLICFTDEGKTLGKIGSLAPSRGYISNLASYFGGALLCYGTDDSVEYEYLAPDDILDFSQTSGYCYTEYNSFVYTNADLVNAFVNNSKVNQTITEEVSLPYDFLPVGERVMLDGDTANTVSIQYSDSNSTQLTYSQSDRCYYLSKNATVKTDLLNDRTLKYDNVFVLYADSTTYESAETTQLILSTDASGSGIYMTDGECVEILWEKGSDGNLSFYDQSGNRLYVNRGTSYIGFVKSSMKSSVKIS